MEAKPVLAEEGKSIDGLAESCCEVAIGCVDVGGIVNSVIESSSRLRVEHRELQRTVEALSADQRQVAQASDEARVISQNAISQLGQGTELIRSSLDQIALLVQLVDRLTQHVTGFGAAIEQVRRSSHDIDTIAQTTSILALNATIEAARAGEFGRSFSVVADEVKALARSTRDATAEISRTIEALGKEADQVIVEIDSGAEVNSKARDSVSKIEETLSVVSEMIDEVDRQNSQVTSANAAISDHVDLLHTSLKSVDCVAQENVDNLERVQVRAGDLENTAKVMFDELVHAGLSPKDDAYVALGTSAAQEIVAIAESAIESGSISEDGLFDDNYIEIADSHPQRYRNNACDWANANWRPVLDRIKASKSQIAGTVCMDRNGFVPTHLSEFSRPPTGDYDHDVKYCRNGRKFPILSRSLDHRSSDYSMSTYRFEADGEGRGYTILRVVSVPLFIRGQHWGDYTLTYAV